LSDEQIQEFNLDGKQLAFVVISGIAVAVVIFLCGVMVGRGVRPSQASGTTATGASTTSDTTPGALADLADAGQDLTLPNEDLPHLDRLNQSPPPETLRDPIPERPVENTPDTPAPTPAAETAKATPAAETSLDEPPGPGYAVQVRSLKRRSEADAEAMRLRSKGYKAFVSPGPGAPPLFRVRVGKYPKESEARAVAARLAKEEKFPGAWVDRSP
jgi:cell division septation protein DedD